MQPQPEFGQSLGERVPDLLGLALGRAMHYRIVGETLELHARELPGQEQVERVVHEQIRQDGRDR